MNTRVLETVEAEVVPEETMSLIHSRLIHRISVALLPYEDRFDILPELEFELREGRLKPDVALLPHQRYDYSRDLIRVMEPPVTAIEIHSPTQDFNGLVAKITDQYLPSGVLSAWLVLPIVRNIYLFLPGQPPQVFSGGTMHDPVTHIEINLDTLFR